MDRDRYISGIAVLEPEGSMATAYRASASYVAHLTTGAFSWSVAIRRWRAAVREFRPDVVMLYGSRANLIGRVTLVGTGIPIVSGLRSVSADERNSRAAIWLDRLTFGRVAVCVANSAAALHRYAAWGFPSERLVHIPSGIDLSRFTGQDRQAARALYGLGPRDLVVLCVANLKPVKNHRTLIQAFAGVVNSGDTRMLLWLVGDGPLRPQLERLSGSLEVADRIVFCGEEVAPVARYAAADVFVLASHFEGLPTAVLEALAAGVPVIASGVGDTPTLLNDGAGIVLEPPFDAATLRGALQQLVDQPMTRCRLSERGRSRAAAYEWRTTVSRYEELLAGVAAGARPSARGRAA
jgi:glycosyltransferase involved in cell wall biosynthesis